jgi:hypothetical protein
MKLKFDYPITNFDIINFCSKYNIILNGVLMLDKFKGQMGYFIVNLDNSKGGGTHWVALIHKPEYTIYFDSFGVIPAPQIINNCKSKILYYSIFIIQQQLSVLCGYFCIGLLHFIQNDKTKSIKNRFNNYTKLFYDNSFINDSVIITYIKDIVDKH